MSTHQTNQLVSITHGVGFVRYITHNGRPTWRAVRTFTETYIDETGEQKKRKRQVKGMGATRQIAWERMEKNAATYLSRTQGGTIVPPLAKHRLTVGEWVEEWFAGDGFRRGKSHGTLANYENKIRYHITPHIGEIKLDQLTSEDVRRLIEETLPAKRKPNGEPLLGSSPLRAVHNILNMALNEAVARKHLTTNPLAPVKRPKRDKPRERPNAVHLRWLPRTIIARYGYSPQTARWILAFYGLRQSERLGVQTTAFTNLNDPKKPTTLDISYQLEPGTLNVVNRTKTKAGTRIITLPEETTKILQTWFRQREEWKQSPDWNPEPRHADLFFTTPTGKPITHQQDRREWKKLCDEIKVEKKVKKPITVHFLRHISATLLAETGTPPQVARLILGHSSTAMTLYYTSFTGQTTAEATRRAESHLFTDYHEKQERDRKKAEKAKAEKEQEKTKRQAATRARKNPTASV